MNGVAIEAALLGSHYVKKSDEQKLYVAYKQIPGRYQALCSERPQELATLGLAGDGTVDAELAPESVGGASRH